jgi:hypothetical protein
VKVGDIARVKKRDTYREKGERQTDNRQMERDRHN